MPILDQTSGQPHTLTTLTHAINMLPRQPRQMLNNVTVESVPVRGTSLTIDRNGSTIDVIDPTPYESPPSVTELTDYAPVALPVPHYHDQSSVKAAEVSGRRAFGTETVYEMPLERLNQKLQLSKNKFELTYEYGLIGALQARIKNRAGATVVNLETQFGIGPTQLLIDLDDAELNPFEAFRAFRRELKEKLGAYFVERWKVFATGDYYEAIVTKEAVKKAFDRWQDGAFLREGPDEIEGFPLARNMRLIEYENAPLPQTKLSDGTVLPGVTVFPDDRFLIVPDVPGLIKRYHAPKQGMSTVNELGAPMYASPHDLPHDEGTEINLQSNFVTAVDRPEAIGVVTQV